MDSTSSTKSQHLHSTWRSIKYIQVYKWLFWNVVFGVLVLTFGSQYKPRFYISLALIGIIVISLLFKIVVAMGYFIAYRCCKRIDKPERSNKLIRESFIKESLEVHRGRVMEEVLENYEVLRGKYEALKEKGKLGSGRGREEEPGSGSGQIDP